MSNSRGNRAEQKFLYSAFALVAQDDQVAVLSGGSIEDRLTDVGGLPQ